ncbi:MAG: class I SAM-dependent methyltransferase [bacterium]|nr:class I SAM-dependent methyltransferase [bacterium]
MLFYKLRVLALNHPFLKRIFRKLNKIFDCGGADDLFDNGTLIKKYAGGGSFADIGALWGIDGGNSFLAEESGATRVVAVDVYPASEKFIAEKARRNSKVEFIEGDVNLASTTGKIGECDVVFCSGVLYHTPDPFHLLTRLRSICRGTLILNTASIPELPGIRNGAVFYPFLSDSQRKIWNRHIGSQKAITGPYEPESGYGNWFWGLTPSTLGSMLRLAGFEVMERYVSPFRSVMVCRATRLKFEAASGEWTTPKGADSLKFRK